MSKENEKKDMREMVQNIVSNLRNRGVNVRSAAILDLGGNKEPNKISKAEQNPGKQCFCPNCFRFDNFQEKLAPLGGEFGYHEFIMFGEIFQVKGHKDPKGELNIMLQKKEEEKVAIDYSKWPVENLQVELNKVIQEKDFEEAQVILNVLNNLKTK